jgi:DNA primase
MGKISPVSSKYIVHSTIQIDGVVDRPDVIGAVFGQTEGLLGADLELREMQRSGRIGRIEVNTETRGGKTSGTITIPSSLDKAETAIVGAALEIIQRIGPCNAKVSVEKIEDVRISKRKYVIDRAKELLKIMMDDIMPDSQEIAEEVTTSVRVMEIQEYGPDRLPAGPAVEESDEIIVVEGRADVVNLLKYGFKNVIGMNGTSVPPSIGDISKKKIITAFVDGDRGGDLIIKELLAIAEIDYVTKAPDGKEVEELAKKEIHKALRARVVPEQLRFDKVENGARRETRPSRPLSSPQQTSRRPPFQSQSQGRRPPVQRERPPVQRERFERRERTERPSASSEPKQLSSNEKSIFKEISGNLIGTRGAYLFDEKLTVLGKVPLAEIDGTLKSLDNIYAIVLDGAIDKDLVNSAESANVKRIVGMESKVKPGETRITLSTIKEL